MKWSWNVGIFLLSISAMSSFVSVENWRDTMRRTGVLLLFPLATSCSQLIAASFMLEVQPVALISIRLLWHMYRQLLIKFQQHPDWQLLNESHRHPRNQLTSLGPSALWRNGSCLSSIHRSVLIWATGLQRILQSSGPQPYLFQCGLNLSLGEEQIFHICSLFGYPPWTLGYSFELSLPFINHHLLQLLILYIKFFLFKLLYRICFLYWLLTDIRRGRKKNLHFWRINYQSICLKTQRMQRIRQFDFLQSIANEHNTLIIINEIEKKTMNIQILEKNSHIKPEIKQSKINKQS